MFNGHNTKSDFLKYLNFKLLINLIVIVLFGILNIYLCTNVNYPDHPFIFAKKQLIWFGISLISMYLILKYDYRIIYRYVPIIYWGTVVLLIAVWIPGIGAKINGARGWINLKVFMLQPAEIAKFSIMLMLSKLINDMEGKINNVKNLAKIAIYLAIPMFLILIQKDMGMTMVCFFVALGILFIAGLDLKIIFWGFASLISIIAILWNTNLILKHQKDRILEFISSESDVTGQGYQLAQGIIGIGSGGIFGNELSLKAAESSSYTATHVPEIQTDFIFTAIAEQWGFIGGAFLILLYVLLILQILKIARKAPDKFGELICVGLASYILFAITQNIGMTLKMLPITGITLPFISYGGSSLWTSLIAMALILNIDLTRKKSIFTKSKNRF